MKDTNEGKWFHADSQEHAEQLVESGQAVYTPAPSMSEIVEMALNAERRRIGIRVIE